MLKRYLKFLYLSKNEHSLHSPFVFELYTKIIKVKTNPNNRINKIEELRKSLKKNNNFITITDFGAGSKTNNKPQRSIASIAKNAEKPKKIAQLIYRLVHHFKPNTVLDLGTSLGITTLYQAEAYPDATIFSFEGCPETAQIAQKNFDKLDAKNIKIVIGNIDHTLPETIQNLPKIDFVFFDANHQYHATMAYFETCKAKAHQDTFFIFDDIYWSAGMEKAWKEIVQHPDVMISIDLFYLGIVFFRKNQPKQHFVLRF
ncbi:MAG: class I SAM-dependent methyltransferase [Pseudarcicella sp.]|nr:class I SAM-dependent methyltransferase [Pseudarcicella sp.]MBP6409586.1 class I SAM-dependent methyltransferase [Pseudarcicella sp.]